MWTNQYLQNFHLKETNTKFQSLCFNTIYKFSFSIFSPIHVMIETFHLHPPKDQKVLMTMKIKNLVFYFSWCQKLFLSL